MTDTPSHTTTEKASILANAQNIYMVGIKGFGMSSLAVVLSKMGKHVTGSDVDQRFPTDELLDKLDIPRVIGFDPKNVPENAEFVITTGAYSGLKNPEVLAAEERGIPVATHAEALGLVMDLYTNRIAVCGCHGKTTTSSMLAYVLFHMGCKMGYQVGVPSFSGLPGGDHNGNEYFVVEADEYAASPGTDNTPRFHFLRPNAGLCMNVDLDHVDVYDTLDDVKSAFKIFFETIKSQRGFVVYCRDDEHATSVAQSVSDLKAISYGFSESSDVRISMQDSVATLTWKDGTQQDYELQVPGKHNVLNAAGVLCIVKELGLTVKDTAAHLGRFSGSQLRYEVLLDTPDASVINDYGHHPVEVRATIAATREKYPNRRIRAIFHPHTLSRTKKFEHEFIDELLKADEVYLMDIFASAREQNDGSLRSSTIVENARERTGSDVIHYMRRDGSLDQLLSTHKPGDVYLFIGAGDKYYLYKDLITRLSR